MSELFYSINSERYDTEDGPHDCQILRLFHNKEHWAQWRQNPDSTRPIDTVECAGGRCDEDTQKYLEWASLAEDENWNKYADAQSIMAGFDQAIADLKEA